MIVMRTIHAWLVASLVLLSSPVMADDAPMGDIQFKGSGSRLALPKAEFRHWTHRMKYRCSVCHEKMYKMKRGANKTNMAAMMEGKYCGSCHNGQEAFNIEFANCTRCHIEPVNQGTAGAARKK